MKLHLFVVAISITLVVLAKSVQPFRHVNQLDDEKSIFTNQHKYAEGSDGDNRHIRAEIHGRDRASGHYNILSQQSAVEVKYVADESGYHPSVKYNHSDDHSRSSATLRFGKDAVNNPEIAKSDISSAKIERRLIHASEPTHRTGKSITDDVPNSGLKKPSNNIEFPPTSDNIGIHQGSQISSLSAIPLSSPTTISNQKQDDVKAIESGKDQPVIENEGSFGQRLRVTKDQFIRDSTTPNSATGHNELSTSSTRRSRYFRVKQRRKNSTPYIPETIPGLGAYSSTPSTSADNSFTANSVEFEGDRPQKHENDGTPDSLGLQSYIPSSSPVLPTNNPLLVNYAFQGVSLNTTGTSSATAADLGRKEYSFLNPIVVADTTGHLPFQYSTTFECEDDVTTSAPDLLESGKRTLDKTSSHVLNSIQAGVSLVNAGEAHLIASTNEIQPAPVKEEVEETYPIENPLVELSNMLGIQRNKYIPSRPSFNGKKDLLREQAQRDDSVEIQKSVEIFHSSPVHEIHYPEQGILAQGDNFQISLSSGINSLQLNDNNQANLHEVNDSQPKDSVTIQPVYVVPPSTYLLDALPSVKSNQQQDSFPQSTTNGDQNSPLIKSEDFENSPHYQAYQSIQNGESHKPEAAHDQQRVHSLHSELSGGIVYADDADNPPTHLTQKTPDKGTPFSIEHIIESRLPIPPPYPYSSGVPVSNPIPTHIQNVHGKRTPHPVAIAPVFPSRKQIHNPHLAQGDKHLYIPIALGTTPTIPQPYPFGPKRVAELKVPQLNEPPKFVEKPSMINAPYGVHYGVSYQQIMKPQNPGLYSQWSKRPTHSYALPSKHMFQNGDEAFPGKQNDFSHNKLNHSQFFRSQGLDRPNQSSSQGKGSVTKLVHDNHLPHGHHSSNAFLDRRLSPIFRTNEPERAGYLGPVPTLQHVQRLNGFPSKGLGLIPHHVVERRHNLRRGRSQEPAKYPQKGNFRQSKVEYGFKPPLVPSIQYDEDTASKVEN